MTGQRSKPEPYTLKQASNMEEIKHSQEAELIFRIVEQWGNAACGLPVMVQWLKEYAAKQAPSAVWVRASERLPGYETPVKWRDGNNHNNATSGKISLIQTAAPNLDGWEWLDEDQVAEAGKLTQERADFIREVNNRDLGGVGDGDTWINVED